VKKNKEICDFCRNKYLTDKDEAWCPFNAILGNNIGLACLGRREGSACYLLCGEIELCDAMSSFDTDVPKDCPYELEHAVSQTKGVK